MINNKEKNKLYSAVDEYTAKRFKSDGHELRLFLCNSRFMSLAELRSEHPTPVINTFPIMALVCGQCITGFVEKSRRTQDYADLLTLITLI